MKVHFIEIGRGKRSWIADCSTLPADDGDVAEDGTRLPSLDWIAAEAKRNGGLMSSDISASETGGEQYEFQIFAGFRSVGLGWIETEATK